VAHLLNEQGSHGSFQRCLSALTLEEVLHNPARPDVVAPMHAHKAHLGHGYNLHEHSKSERTTVIFSLLLTSGL
jgi:hypothetical protein